jgi:hypothetical protein
LTRGSSRRGCPPNKSRSLAEAPHLAWLRNCWQGGCPTDKGRYKVVARKICGLWQGGCPTDKGRYKVVARRLCDLWQGGCPTDKGRYKVEAQMFCGLWQGGCPTDKGYRKCGLETLWLVAHITSCGTHYKGCGLWHTLQVVTRITSCDKYYKL